MSSLKNICGLKGRIGLDKEEKNNHFWSIPTLTIRPFEDFFRGLALSRVSTTVGSSEGSPEWSAVHPVTPSGAGEHG